MMKYSGIFVFFEETNPWKSIFEKFYISKINLNAVPRTGFDFLNLFLLRFL